jgi:ubiquinone/menaquinone biosynthesis C-methylase UbiE
MREPQSGRAARESGRPAHGLISGELVTNGGLSGAKAMSGHEQQNAAVLDQFTQQAESYAVLVKQGASRRSAGDVVAFSGASATDEVLDVACGAGHLTLDLAKVVQRAVGIDLTPAMLDQARALQAEQGVANVEWVQGDALPLPFTDARFDLVVTRASFHHMHDPGAVLSQMRRVARPGGRVVVSDLTPATDRSAAFDEMENLRDPSHVHALPIEELREIGRKAGLEELRIEPYSGELPLEAVLATSFPPPGALDEVRRRFAAEAETGTDNLGFRTRRGEGKLYISYPMTTVVWRAP